MTLEIINVLLKQQVIYGCKIMPFFCLFLSVEAVSQQ